MIIFDSRIPHRVTPVTKGKRISLVSWMLGPKLK
jgi:predicted 2-oxoglutarate/Fe(II)-dependent dioxygenase YbiX